MAYSSWSVVFGEQPSAAKWNILGSNDASFNDGSGFANDIIKSKHIDWADTGSGDEGGIWWEEIGRTTLGSAGDTISVTPIAARKYLKIYVIAITSGSTNTLLRFNGDSSANYSYRSAADGGADSTAVSQTEIQLSASGTTNVFDEIDVINIATTEKYVITHSLRGTSSAAAAPNRLEAHGKWANTSAQITRADVVNTSTGDYATGSEVVVLGHN